MTRRAVIVEVARTPFGRGREDGALHGVHPVDLFAGVIEAVVARSGLDPGRVQDVIGGCSIPAGEQAANVARHAALAAGLPESVPGVTIDRKCGSSLQALQFAAGGIAAGDYDAVVVGGVEMMGTVPMKANRLGRDATGPRLAARYPAGLVHQGVSAELIAARWGLSREECDRWSLRSHQRATRARDSGFLDRQIIPVTRPNGAIVAVDESIRDATTLERLNELRPSFHTDEMAARFPEIQWMVTAGSSSPVSDGASAALVVAEDLAERWGLRGRARVVAGTAVGSDPLLMLTGVIPATEKLLQRTGLTIDAFDTIEVNEAFAPVVLAWLADTKADPDRVNPAGGAIAIGHPAGATGTRLVATAIDALHVHGGRRALITVCESGGMANAMVVERIP